MNRTSLLGMVSAAVAATAALSSAAEARCTKLAFSVNDYGKAGPTADAQKLLDTYIAKWTAERGVKSYTTGKKDVTCELFLDVGLFDEHTCKAAATVCWPGNEDYASRQPVPVADGPVKAAAAKPAAKVPTKVAAKPSPITTGSIPAPATAPVKAKADPAAETAPPAGSCRACPCGAKSAVSGIRALSSRVPAAAAVRLQRRLCFGGTTPVCALTSSGTADGRGTNVGATDARSLNSGSYWLFSSAPS
jgi:hypothetical protein